MEQNCTVIGFLSRNNSFLALSSSLFAKEYQVALFSPGNRLTCSSLPAQLSDLVALVRGKLSRMQRTILSALIVIEVHAKDVAAKLIEENVQSENDFEWISQLR